jgi:predicted DNA-binding transcriptional regulator YafY
MSRKSPSKPGLERGRSRPPLERMLRIHQAVQAGNLPNATGLAAALEVSTKTVNRDLEFMRDRLELPLEYDPARFGYRYTQPVSSFPTLQITDGELFALLVAEKALQQYRGTHFEKPLVSAFRKMVAALPDTVSLNLAEWEQTIAFRTSAEPILNLEIFDALARAAARHRQLKIGYRKPGSASSEERVVDPYQLANINGEWFLFAFDHLRKDLRTFVPARIRTVAETGRAFARPQKFSVEKRLQDSFGVFSGQGEYQVTIRFSAAVADYIREKRWHASQQVRELGDGGVELQLKLSSLEEVKRWVLNWAGHAVVVRPKELAQAVRQAAELILQKQSA